MWEFQRSKIVGQNSLKTSFDQGDRDSFGRGQGENSKKKFKHSTKSKRKAQMSPLNSPNILVFFLLLGLDI